VSTQLDRAYRRQRLQVSAGAAAGAERLLAVASPQDQQAFVERVIPVVQAGQTQTVRLVDAYLAAKTLHATGDGSVRGLDPDNYSTSRLRGLDARLVYSRPFGALGSGLSRGLDFPAARLLALAALHKLVLTDMQLAQTYAARDWMEQEEAIVGWARETAGGCALCVVASTRVYSTGDLMPIHEGCRCDVVPVYGERTVSRTDEPISKDSAENDLSADTLSRLGDQGLALPDELKARHDSELGSRLVSGAWA
jgi:hypothetical protein